jgi:flagellar P-ring protein precursor FlgI
MMRARVLALAGLLLLAALPAHAQVPARVGDVTLHPGNVPRRLVGYGIVTGLDGTGDRSFGSSGTTPSVRSVVNMLRRFNVEVPPEQLRLRDVAAVAVTAEVSPWLRAGGRFEVQVSALGDATSLRGGVLWITPLVSDPGEPPVATAQGSLYMSGGGGGAHSLYAQRANSARVPQGGVLEVDPERVPAQSRRLVVRQPDLPTAARIAAAINSTFGGAVARVDDPGSILLSPPANADSGMAFFASVDTVLVVTQPPARIVIDGREGTLVSGGDIRIGPAVIHHHGVTLAIGASAGALHAAAADSSAAEGYVNVAARSSVQDVASGLHAAGVRAEDMAAIFEALQASGALRAEVVVR